MCPVPKLFVVIPPSSDTGAFCVSEDPSQSFLVSHSAHWMNWLLVRST